MIRDLAYHKPDTIKETIELLGSCEGKTSLLAGGTDLVVNMRKDAYHPDNVIDVKGIEELKRLEYSEDEGLYLGGLVTCNQLIFSEMINEKYPVLVEACKKHSSHQIRNRATVVGNICGASPGADLAPALLVLGTEVDVVGPNGERLIPLVDFFTGVKRNALEEGEIVRGLKVASPIKGYKANYSKKARIKGPDLSAVGVAGLASREEGVVRFAFGAVAPTPVYLDVSDLFAEKDYKAAKEELMEKVDASISPITDVRSTEKYRRRIAGVYTRRLLEELWGEGDK